MKMDKSKLCVMCLSYERQLQPVDKLKNSLLLTNISLSDMGGGACWECTHILLKFLKFKHKVQQAQKSLQNIKKNTEIKSLSALSSETKCIYDYEYNYTDPLNEIDHIDIVIETKIEPEIKEEIDEAPDYEEIEQNELSDNETNEERKEFDFEYRNKTDEKYNLKKEPERNFPDKKKEKMLQNFLDEDNDEVECNLKDTEKDKFETVVFTDDELVKNREEKRNHPNFKKIPFKCDSCVLGFTRKETYDAHIEKKHDESIGIHTCNVCGIRFATVISLDRHRSKHYTLYKCKLCNYSTIEMWSIYNHCRAKHKYDKVDSIHCQECSYAAKTPEDLAEHIRTQHTLFCNECGEKFKGKNTLRTHKARIHTMKREFTCDVCKKTFVNKTRLESHMVTHNNAIAKKLSYCTVCNVQYKNIYVYRNHLKNSANHSERYSCPECKKKFASKVYWQKHYNFYHLHKSQFKCEICNKLFISDWRLKNHKQKHHGLTRSRDHGCNVCGKKFFTQSTLRGHQLTHSEERTYMCEDCGHTFKQRPALYTHYRLLHKRAVNKNAVAQDLA